MDHCELELTEQGRQRLNLQRAKDRLDYLLLEFVLPREQEKRQKIYQEIALLLEWTELASQV
jgi:hypothetical protein